jgi:hypothetical protein
LSAWNVRLILLDILYRFAAASVEIKNLWSNHRCSYSSTRNHCNFEPWRKNSCRSIESN